MQHMVMFKESHGSTLNMEPFFYPGLKGAHKNQQQIHYIMTITHVSHMKQVHVFICVHYQCSKNALPLATHIS